MVLIILMILLKVLINYIKRTRYYKFIINQTIKMIITTINITIIIVINIIILVSSSSSLSTVLLSSSSNNHAFIYHHHYHHHHQHHQHPHYLYHNKSNNNIVYSIQVIFHHIHRWHRLHTAFSSKHFQSSQTCQVLMQLSFHSHLFSHLNIQVISRT